MTKEEFIAKVTTNHNIKYDYSLIPQKFSTHGRIKIICPIHGEFLQEARRHYKGGNCPKCANIISHEKKRYTTKQFIEKANKKHNGYYNYDKVKYEKSDIPIVITCPKHGDFKQAPRDHLRGQGCAKCAAEKGHPSQKKDTATFIRQAIAMHNGFYDYSQVMYQGKDVPVIIICPKHGEFKQTPHAHLSGQGCWKCRAHLSLFEQEIRGYIKSIENNIEFGNRDLLPHFEIDVYSPQNKVGFECDGLYWHSDKNKPKYYHINKTSEAEKQRIQLIHIFEDEWEYKRDICKSLIAKALSACSNKVTQCCAKLINHEEAKSFLDDNSLNGYQEATLHIGLFSNGELVAVSSFEDKDKYFELIQYYEKQDAVIENGFKTMFDYFVNRYFPTEVVIRVDKRWKNDLPLEKVGFEHISDELPSFKYVKEKRRLTVQEVVADEKLLMKMQENKLPKIYDCGQEVWKWEDI